jgi:hypothetical protein
MNNDVIVNIFYASDDNHQVVTSGDVEFSLVAA